MEKFIYSKKGKAVFFILQHICVVIITICIAVIILFSSIITSSNSRMYGYGVSPFDNARSFEDTENFTNMLRDSANEISRYAVIRDQMETNGKFDENKEIDIIQFANRYEQPNNKGGIPYYLEDLIKWGQYGVVYEDGSPYVYEEDYTFSYENGYSYDNSNDLIVGFEATSESQDDFGSDLPQILITEPADQSESATAAAVEITPILERYKPIGGDTIADYIAETLTYRSACNYLYESIQALTYNYHQYRQFQTFYQEDKTNLRYYIEKTENEEKNSYSNLPKGIQGGKEEEYIKGLGKYICYDAKTLSYSTNTGLKEEEITNILNSYEYAYSDNSRIMIGLDTTYPAVDNYSVANANFNTIGRWIEPIIIIVVICVSIIFIMFILLSMVAGKNKRNAEVVPIWFDRLNTECSFAVAFVVCGAAVFVTGLSIKGFYQNNFDGGTIIFCASAGVLVTHMLLMFFYLSIVRRIKSHTLWKNSLFYKIGSFIKKIMQGIINKIKELCFRIFDNGRLTIRTWVPFISFLFINYILLMWGMTSTLIALAFDMLIGWYLFNENKARKRVVDGIELIKDGDMSYQVDIKGMHGDNLILAESVNTLGGAVRRAVETSMKDERLKADLITNVSHDIKTPLTSIINYVDLIRREDIQNEKIRGYINILDAKSQRLKHLTEDLVEASKISSGNIILQMTKLNFIELLNQTTGEFSENFANKSLQTIVNVPEHPVVIEADSRRMWRVIENLFRNIEKYAMENTRVYIDVVEEKQENKVLVNVTIRNISKHPLNISADDLTKRFIRGDISRNTEGSGLGLSIAKNLVELQGGTFEIYLDGDLFKVMIGFPEAEA